MRSKIIGTGLSGLVGKPLCEALKSRYDVMKLSRIWDNGKINPSNWDAELNGAEAVINLSGENIAGKRWTAKQKEELRNSRIQTTRELVKAIAQAHPKPKVFLSGSAIGYYGARDEARVGEASAKGSGFLPDLCEEWEREALKASAYGVRVVLLRTGIVLAKNGGALAKMSPPFKMFIGGPLGSGKQFMSWIHIDDEVNAIIKCLEDERLKGPVNLTAPNAVSNKEFSKILAKTLHRPCLAPVPPIALKLLLGEMSEMLLTGQNVYPQALIDAGYQFKYPELATALADLLK